MSRKKRLFKKKGNVIKDLTRKVLKVLNADSNKSFNYKQICAKMGVVNAGGKAQVIKKLEELKAQKKIEETSRGKYKINLAKDYYTGTVDLTSSGNGYFICEEFEDDVFIPSINLNHALQDDTVKVYVYKRRRNKKLEGEVVEIIQRAKKEFVGVLQMSKNFGFVVPDNPKMYADIFIAKNKVGDAEDGDKVVAKITDWPENSKNPFGKITTVLGKPGEHDTEIHSILLEYGLPYNFPPEVEKEASELPIEITEEEIAKRRDMRSVTTFTIDPKDAKDFDDALSFEKLENGNIEIGVHIADVSHYVQPDTILDEEAYSRATSVYLVDRVVPMLPEVLSNNVCSLRPNEEKLTFSAVFEMNNKAEIVNKWFGRTVTYSDHRFTYEDAQAIIESGEGKFVEEITTLDKLAKILRGKRLDAGAITFDNKIEVKFNLDEEANPTGVYFKEQKDSNKLIEEFMLLANKKVAEFIGFTNGRPTNKTFIYRVHDEPDSEKLTSLQNIVNKFGYKIDTHSRKSTTDSLNKLLKDVSGKGEANMVETLTIRSMSKALYTTDNIGHYGLAFDYYSHFTSPIRRYPDVMTHRLLQHYLDGGKSPNAEVYEDKSKHSSDREQLAARAERDSIKYMQVKYMEDHKDEEFEGVISGVTEWGIYVEIKSNKCEGMIRTRDLKDDYYIFDEEQYALVGQSSHNLYQLGDDVVIKVKNTDLERKHLDFELIEKL
ncbi:ribonuclease R [Aureivirga sp. CE67]|uniref:ribonuclease R n=1 Tax=Aureivirga sp. CE67 TaxID=1788983 RepID=UPI0018CAA8BD|nr:ribonuclease R [Aureivirga sp. CE67]